MGSVLRRCGFCLLPVLMLVLVVPVRMAGPAAVAAPLNDAPTATILAPASGATVPARTAVSWQGSDTDGSIVRFEYAVDPPEAFTAEEIASPETAPGVTITVLPGPDANRDTLRVSKPFGGGTVNFDYVQTPMTFEEMLFMTPNPDSVQQGSVRIPVESYSATHTLLVRSCDDQGAYSPPASTTFTARTETPTTWITRPLATAEILQVGEVLRIEWTGADPDGADGPTTAPAGYVYKLVDLRALNPPVSLLMLRDPEDVVYTADSGPWIPVSAESTGVTLAVPAGDYLFAVRAVDEAGAIDPFVEFGRSRDDGNARKFVSSPGAGLPEFTLHDEVAGTFRYTTNSSAYAAEVGQNAEMRFGVACSAAVYGGECEAVRWGLNLEDPDSEAGWSSWDSGWDLPALVFATPGPQSLHVQIRDTFGQTLRGRLDLDVAPMAFDRDILWVDDARDATYPRDSEHDTFWRNLFAGHAGLSGSTVDELHTFGMGDYEFIAPQVPSLQELGRYRAVVWDCVGSGYNGVTSLLESASRGTTLRAYLRTGGRLWISGTFTVAALDAALPGGGADFAYPHEILPGSFPWDFLKMYSEQVANDKNAHNDRHGMLAVEPFPGATVQLPGMLVDDNKLNPVLRGKYGVGGVDAIFDPLLQTTSPGFTGAIDSLYVMRARYPYLGLGSSVYDNRLVGYRWHDPAAHPVQGRFVWFGFPMYYFRDVDAQQAFNRVMDWLLEEEPVPVDLLNLTAQRVDDGAEIRWQLADADRAIGFHVFREAPGGARVRLTEALLTGGPEFVFRDPVPPVDRVDYWLQEVDRSGESSWHGPIPLAAISGPFVSLSPIRPNPFAASAAIAFSLPRREPIRLSVIDVRGREVAVLVDETRDAGAHEVAWGGRLRGGATAPAGVYFFRLATPEAIRVRKAILAR